MKNLTKKSRFGRELLALVVVGAALGNGYARDLIWVGGAEGADAKKWDLSTLNWRVAGDETRTPVAFESGDNVRFDDTAASFAVSMQQVTPQGQPSNVFQYNIGDVVFSNDVNNYSWEIAFDYTWTQARGAMGSIDKWGVADLTINSRFDATGNFTCHAGRIFSRSGSWFPSEYRSTVGSMHNTRTILFEPGTTIDATAALLGGPRIDNAIITAIFNGASVKLTGNQSFHYATFTNCPSFFASAGNIICEVDVKFKGHGLQPHVFGAAGDYQMAFKRGISNFATIYVDDLTGDGVTVDNVDDLIVSNRLCAISMSGNGATYLFNTSFRKDGKGTMVLSNSKGSTATGDVEVVEGRLVVNGTPSGISLTGSNWLYSAIGAVAGTRTRTVTVKEGAELEFRTSQATGALNTPQEWNLVVDGGTLIIDENVSASFGSLTLKDATFVYSNGQSSGWFPSWGTMVVAQKLAFDGSTPYDLTVPAHTGLRDVPYLTLGFTLSSEKGDEPVKPAWPHLTNLWTVVDFDVTDITKDSETDATIRLPIRNMVNMSYTDYNNTAINGYTYNPWQWCHFQGGIRKTGPGTLCLNGAISYTHTTEVAGGALLVDSSIATSSGVTVDSDAWLGGTGTVAAVTVKDGGGFICYAGRNTANVLRVPSLTAEGEVVVRVANPDGRETTDFRQPVLQLTAKPSSVDFQNWRVSYEGEEDHWRSFSFRYDPGTGVVSAFYSGGTMVIFR